MKNALLLLWVVALAFGTAGTAGAIVINYDDVAIDPAGWVVLDSNYQGFSWSAGWEVTNDT